MCPGLVTVRSSRENRNNSKYLKKKEFKWGVDYTGDGKVEKLNRKW